MHHFRRESLNFFRISVGIFRGALGDITVLYNFQMSKKLKDKTKEDMSKVLDCSSFQIKPLQACISETTFGDFSLPDSGIQKYIV